MLETIRRVSISFCALTTAMRTVVGAVCSLVVLIERFVVLIEAVVSRSVEQLVRRRDRTPERSAEPDEDAGEEPLIGRRVVRHFPAPFPLGHECFGARNGDLLIVARSDVQDTVFDGDISDDELEEIRISGMVRATPPIAERPVSDQEPVRSHFRA